MTDASQCKDCVHAFECVVHHPRTDLPKGVRYECLSIYTPLIIIDDVLNGEEMCEFREVEIYKELPDDV